MIQEREITLKDVFKGYWEDLNIPETWTNVSYHNDTCPSWIVNGYQVFIDHPVADRREMHPCPRFHVMTEEGYGETEAWHSNTDDWEKVLNQVQCPQGRDHNDGEEPCPRT